MENALVFGEELYTAIAYVANIITTFASMTFPGTSIPYIMIPIGVWGIYFVWKVVLGNMFDVEWKK